MKRDRWGFHGNGRWEIIICLADVRFFEPSLTNERARLFLFRSRRWKKKCLSVRWRFIRAAECATNLTEINYFYVSFGLIFRRTSGRKKKKKRLQASFKGFPLSSWRADFFFFFLRQKGGVTLYVDCKKYPPRHALNIKRSNTYATWNHPLRFIIKGSEQFEIFKISTFFLFWIVVWSPWNKIQKVLAIKTHFRV